VAENLAAARRAVPAPPATDNDSAFASADLRSQDAVAPVPHDVEQTEGTTTYIDFKVLVFQFLTALVLQWQARKRGYSPLLWFLATLLSHVFVTMSILAMLPDRSLAKQRARETQAVDALLANRRGQTAPLPSGAIGQESIGDALTQAT